MSNYNTKRVSLIPRLSQTLWSCESRYAPRHSTLGGLSKQEWGAIATSVKAVGNSALENEMRNMSQAIQQLTGYVGNMNQSISSRIDLLHANMEQNSRILGDMISRVQVIEVIVEKKIPELNRAEFAVLRILSCEMFLSVRKVHHLVS